jgi:hypothetical protein
MNRFLCILAILLATGCINGAPLPPTPRSSLTRQPLAPNGELQEAECIQIAQTYVRGLGKDPIQATYEVVRNPELDEDTGSDEAATIALIHVNFLDGTHWRLALKADGDLVLLAN